MGFSPYLRERIRKDLKDCKDCKDKKHQIASFPCP